MLKISSIIFIAAFLLSCNSNDVKKNDTPAGDTTKVNKPDTSLTNNLGYFKIEGDSLVIPAFEIKVSLSPKAEEKLKARKETIIVAAYFSGQPKDTTIAEFQESGAMSVAVSHTEIRNDSIVAKIEGAKFARSLYDSLADKDIQVLINVYSGRRSGPDNLLACDILDEKMSAAQGKQFTIKGKLIIEH